ncbi:MAG: YggS family pyridoxal phosphate enzyme, partial [Gammaproteobacteria bacterium]
MAIPEPSDDPAVQKAVFLQARALFDQLRERGFALDTLSIGMSDDLEAAVAAGSTLVRVGRGIFGHRPRKTAA